MDLRSIRAEVTKGGYSKLTKVLEDIRLIWSNCLTFNQEGSEISNDVIVLGDEVESIIGVRNE